MENQRDAKRKQLNDFRRKEDQIVWVLAFVLFAIVTIGILLFAFSEYNLFKSAGISALIYSTIVLLTDWRNLFRFRIARTNIPTEEEIERQLEVFAFNNDFIVQLDTLVFILGIISIILTSVVWANSLVLGAGIALSFLSAIKLCFDLVVNWRRSECLRKLKTK